MLKLWLHIRLQCLHQNLEMTPMRICGKFCECRLSWNKGMLYGEEVLQLLLNSLKVDDLPHNRHACIQG
jgi:hypothetical protein